MFVFKKYIFIVFVLLSVVFYGQTTKDFLVLQEKCFLALYTSPDEAIALSQTALLNTENKNEKLLLYAIISRAYALKGDYLPSVQSALNFDGHYSSETPSDDYLYQVMLSEQYFNLGLYDLSAKLVEALLLNHSLKHADSRAKLWQLRGNNFSVLNRLNDASNSYETSNKLLTTSTKLSDALHMENDILRAAVLVKSERWLEAEKLLDSVLLKTEKASYNYLSASILERKSKILFQDRKFAQAIKLLERALVQMDSKDYSVLKMRIYESLSKSYLALSNHSESIRYNKMYLDAQQEIDRSKKEAIRYLGKFNERENNAKVLLAESDNKNRFRWFVVVFLLFLASTAVVYFYVKQRFKNLTTQYNFLVKQSSQIPKTADVVDNVVVEKPEKLRKTNSISKEKEEEILSKLDELEASDRFLSPDMSLAVLSGQLDTNTKYLSEIINNYKGKNFNAYINELRVNRMVTLLRTKPEFLTYKVSYLAEYAGFSSHSAFATVFKTITGVSPNTFIQQIQKSK